MRFLSESNRFFAAVSCVALGGLASHSVQALEPIAGATKVTAGDSHSCAIVSGKVQCWGHSTSAQTGIGYVMLEHRSALPVIGLANDTAVSLASGTHHSCALLSGGNVKCWGTYWIAGSIGIPLAGHTYTSATQIAGLESGVAAITDSADHSCALTTGGGVKCWGDNTHGQLGRGALGSFTNAADVVGLTAGVLDVATSRFTTCAVVAGGGVKCWGDRTSGQSSSSVPVDKTSVSGASRIAAHGDSFCAATTGNVVKCWHVGDDFFGIPPQEVTGFPDAIVKLVMGNVHRCALTVSNRAFCWGFNGAGQLGDGTRETRNAPVEVAALAGTVSDVAAGASHSCAAATGGAALCWGSNSYGKLGIDSTDADALSPSAVMTGGQVPVQVRSDFNRDGRSDILWHNSATGILFEMQMNGFSQGASAVIDQKSDTSWRVAAITPGMFGIGTSVFWQHESTGEVYGVNMNGTVKGSERTVYVEPNTNWKIVGAGDFAGDGLAHLLWRNTSTGDVFALNVMSLVVMSGAVIYSEPDLNWQIQQIADFNGDGRADIVWRNTATGDVYMMLMNGMTVAGGGVIYSEPNTAWQIQAAADFNGDGRADVLWRNTTTGDVFMMLMNGTTITGGSVFYGEPNAAWKIAATGDYNGDGRADILWRNTTTGQVFMMLMDGFTITAGDFVYTEPDAQWQIVGP